MFKLVGENIINEKGNAIDVQGGIDSENRNIIVYKPSGKIH
jgi:hypothetical protein